MMGFAIGGPIQQPPALPRNMTQSLGLPNFTSNYGTGLAQDLRGQLFLFTGNPAASPLIETMAYSQIPNFNMPVAQFNPQNPLNTSIDSLYNAPLLQNGVLGGGLLQGNGNVLGLPQTTSGLGTIVMPQGQQQQSIFQPQQLQQQQPLQQTMLGGGAGSIDQSILMLQQQLQQITGQLQGLMQQRAAAQPQQFQPQQPTNIGGVANGGIGLQQFQLQQLMNPQGLQALTTSVQQPMNAMGTIQGLGVGTQGLQPAGSLFQPMGMGMASPTMQGIGGGIQPLGYAGGISPYATAGGQIF
jgi:hypothetical protein